MSNDDIIVGACNECHLDIIEDNTCCGKWNNGPAHSFFDGVCKECHKGLHKKFLPQDNHGGYEVNVTD